MRVKERGLARPNDDSGNRMIRQVNGPLRLLVNEVGQERSWLALHLVGTKSNRSAIGALVRLVRDGRPTLVRRVHADGSFCSANDLRVSFGLGDDRAAQTVIVTWPGGLRETFSNLPVGRIIELNEGTGRAP